MLQVSGGFAKCLRFPSSVSLRSHQMWTGITNNLSLSASVWNSALDRALELSTGMLRLVMPLFMTEEIFRQCCNVLYFTKVLLFLPSVGGGGHWQGYYRQVILVPNTGKSPAKLDCGAWWIILIRLTFLLLPWWFSLGQINIPSLSHKSRINGDKTSNLSASMCYVNTVILRIRYGS